MIIDNPYEHQIAAVKQGEIKNTLFDIDCGLGKTYIFTELGLRYLPLVYVCRAKARRQVFNFILDQYGIRSTIVEKKWLPIKEGVLIINPEKIKKYKEQLIALKALSWVLDESHLFKNSNAQSSRALARILFLTKPLSVTAGTGTPSNRMFGDLPNPLEIYPQADLLDDNAFSRLTLGKVRKDFLIYKTKKDESKKKSWPVIHDFKYENAELYKKYLKEFIFTVRKTDVGHILPDNIKVDIELHQRQLKEYKRIERDSKRDIVVAINDHDVPVLSVMAGRNILQRVASFPEIKNLHSAKGTWFREFYEDNIHDSFLLLGKFITTCDKLVTMCRILGIEDDDIGVIYDGKDTVTGRKPRVIIGTIDSFAGSLDLTWINNLIYFEFHWSAIASKQSRDRIDRGLQKEKNDKAVYYLVAENTIDELMYQNLINNWSYEQLKIEVLKWAMS